MRSVHTAIGVHRDSGIRWICVFQSSMDAHKFVRKVSTKEYYDNPAAYAEASRWVWEVTEVYLEEGSVRAVTEFVFEHARGVKEN